MPQSFLCLSGKQVKRSLETDAAAGSTSLELQTPWPQGLRANLFPQKNFDVYIKNMVLWTPGEIKGPNTNCLKRLVCVEAGTVSGLEQTQFQTGFPKVAGTLYSVKETNIPFTFYVIPVEMVCFQFRERKSNVPLRYFILILNHTNISTGIT